MAARIKRLVVDKNMLEKGLASEWLAKSKKRQLVITDFLLIECMQGDSMLNLECSFAPLVPFVSQLVILKSASSMVGVRPRSSGLQRRWIFNGLTQQFAARLSSGERSFAEQMLADPAFAEYSQRSKAFLESVYANAAEFRQFLTSLIDQWPLKLLKRFRASGHLSNELAAKLFSTVRDTAAALFHDWPRKQIPRFADAIHSFEYRYALACVFLALEWSKGGLPNVRPDNLRNDLVDMTYVAFGTMFDGLMTEESKVKRIYAHSQFMVQVARLVVEIEAGHAVIIKS